jgi:hypothetical protein
MQKIVINDHALNQSLSIDGLEIQYVSKISRVVTAGMPPLIVIEILDYGQIEQVRETATGIAHDHVKDGK